MPQQGTDDVEGGVEVDNAGGGPVSLSYQLQAMPLAVAYVRAGAMNCFFRNNSGAVRYAKV